jgi:hypothetical protein
LSCSKIQTKEAEKNRFNTHIGGFSFNRSRSSKHFSTLPFHNNPIPLTRPRSDFLRKPLNLVRKLSDISLRRREIRSTTCHATSRDTVILLDEDTDVDALLYGAGGRNTPPNNKPSSQEYSKNVDDEGGSFEKLSNCFTGLLGDGLCCTT